MESTTAADRVLVVMKLLAELPNPVRLEDLTRELRVPKSTVHRMLTTLRRAGWATRDEDGRYSVSLEFLRVAFKYYDTLDEPNIVGSTLQALVGAFGETAYYATLDGPGVAYLAMVTAPGYMHTAALVGARQPAHLTGLGKALLAYALPERGAVDHFVATHGPLRAGTQKSITNAAALHRELSATRQRGYAVDDQENEPGVVCIAFPVFLGPSQQPTGAISVAAIELRTPLEKLVARSEEAQAIIRRGLGFGALRTSDPTLARSGVSGGQSVLTGAVRTE